MSSVQNLQKKCLGHPNEYLGTFFRMSHYFVWKAYYKGKKTQFSLLRYLYWFSRLGRVEQIWKKPMFTCSGGGVGEGEGLTQKKVVLGPSRHRSSCRVRSTCAIKFFVNPYARPPHVKYNFIWPLLLVPCRLPVSNILWTPTPASPPPRQS